MLSTNDWAVKTLLVTQDAWPAVAPLYNTATVWPFIPVDPISKEKEAWVSPKFKKAS